MNLLLGIDIGTSGTKAALFDENGNTVQSAKAEYPMYQPQNGWAEQNPLDWWEAVVKTISEVIKKSNIDSTSIKGIGLSGQMHGLVMLDADGNPLYNSIIWCDQRTGRECEQITRLVGAERLIEITANPALTGFTASKIMWMKNNHPEIYKKCAHILLPKDYIRYKLTGVFATDVSDASGMGLLDVPNRCWSDEVLKKLEIDKNLLAKVYESPDVTGEITEQAAKLTGLAKGTIVVGSAGDNAAGAVGTGVVADGKAFTTIGTSGVVFAHTSKLSIDKQGRVHTFCCAVPNAWHVMGVTQGAGLSLKWFRDNFCDDVVSSSKLSGLDAYCIMDNAAKNIPIGAEKLIYLPYLMGERTPHLNPDARGVFFGISAKHTKAHFIRAIMEGVTYSLCDCIGILREMGVEINEMMACGGGGTSSVWRQMLADGYGCDVKTVVSDEGPALGAAILAGVGAGIYRTVEDGCNRCVKTNKPQSPILQNIEEYKKFYCVYRSLYGSLKQNYSQLASI
ncbi:MAG TPA: xylulokinase [Ruminococcaceae bacterium]|nr:xylulokinase [Oscillospiraceae bacterium]